MKKRKATSRKAATKRQSNYSNVSCDSQRQRLVKALELAGADGITTIQAYDTLNIMRPGARISELRKSGISIATVWTTSVNAQGYKHRCARYVLMSLADEVTV